MIEPRIAIEDANTPANSRRVAADSRLPRPAALRLCACPRMLLPMLGSRLLSTARHAFSWTRWLERRRRGFERLLQKRDADALGAAQLLERVEPPRSSLTHVGKQREMHRHDLALRPQLGNRRVEERLGGGVDGLGFLGQSAVRGAEQPSTLRGVHGVEQIDGRGVGALLDRRLQSFMKR